MSQELVTVTIDGQTIQVPKGMLLVEAAKLANNHIPVFCYHPKLDPAGVCRMCLVQVEKMPKLVTACTTPVADGMVVHTMNQQVLDARKSVLEFILLNHPLDCPVCDKGGECDLQDLTYAHGPGNTRLHFWKEHKNKAVDLGPFIVLDEERCIMCRRCVRFDNEVAGENTLVVTERAHEAVVSTSGGAEYDSYFSGNIIELCPVGALTSRQYRFKSRPWDLVKQSGVCTGCSVGCNIRLDYRHGRLMRVVSNENAEIDNGWLCDRGRFNYQYIEGTERLRQPLLRRDGRLVPVSWSEAIQEAGRRLKAIITEHGGDSIGAIGGGRLTNEDAYLFQKLVRTAMGSPNVDHRVSHQTIASVGQYPGKIADVDSASAILIVDALPAETAPVLDLRIRYAGERRRTKLVTMGSALPHYRARHQRVPVKPGRTAAVLSALADHIEGKAKATEPHLEAVAQIEAVAKTLLSSPKLVVIWGGEEREVGQAVVRLLSTLKSSPVSGSDASAKRSIHVMIPGNQSNSRGAEAMGVLPSFLPGFQPVSDKPARQRVEKAWGRSIPDRAGLTTAQMLQKAASGELKALFLAGANLAGTYPDGELAHQALDQVPLLIVQDIFLTQTAQYADIVFPTAPPTAKAGDYTGLDGRVQHVEATMSPVQGDESRPDGAIFQTLSEALQGPKLRPSAQELQWEMQHLAGYAEFLAGAPASLLSQDATGAVDAVVEASESDTDISGALWVIPVDRLHAGGGTAEFDAPYRAGRAKAEATFHPDDAHSLQLVEGDWIELRTAYGSVRYTVRISAEAAPGAVLVPRGLSEAPANRLTGGMRFAAVTVVKQVLEEVG